MNFAIILIDQAGSTLQQKLLTDCSFGAHHVFHLETVYKIRKAAAESAFQPEYRRHKSSLFPLTSSPQILFCAKMEGFVP